MPKRTPDTVGSKNSVLNPVPFIGAEDKAEEENNFSWELT